MTASSVFCETSSNVIQISSRRRPPAAATNPGPAIPPNGGSGELHTPPTGTELMNARLYVNGYLNAAQLAFICGDQIRAGRAIDQIIEGTTP